MVDQMRIPLSDNDLRELRVAVELLEYPGFPARLAGMIGQPIDLLTQSLPPSASHAISTATQHGLKVALDFTLRTMKDTSAEVSRPFLHKSMAVASGALGGAFGLTTLAIELPLSTIIMLRSIADIARSEGESLHDPGTAMACLEVFALGGGSKADNAAESAYYAVRAVMATSISEAVRYVAERSVFEKGAPVLVRLLTNITPRFGLAVTQKFAAQTLPVIGAFGGAVVNYVFIDHFQDVARGHFTVRRLERKYGEDTVRFQYDRVRKELRG